MHLVRVRVGVRVRVRVRARVRVGVMVGVMVGVGVGVEGFLGLVVGLMVIGMADSRSRLHACPPSLTRVQAHDALFFDDVGHGH